MISTIWLLFFGTTWTSYGFNANASVESAGSDKATLVINVQKKNDGKTVSWSMGAGDRMADKFFEQVTEELARMSTQKTAVKQDAPHVDVPPASQVAGANQTATSEIGNIAVTSLPDGAEVSVDGSFVGNLPAVLKLAPGKHTVTVSADGYKSWTKDISVLAGSDVKLNAKLDKN